MDIAKVKAKKPKIKFTKSCSVSESEWKRDSVRLYWSYWQARRSVDMHEVRAHDTKCKNNFKMVWAWVVHVSLKSSTESPLNETNLREEQCCRKELTFVLSRDSVELTLLDLRASSNKRVNRQQAESIIAAQALSHYEVPLADGAQDLNVKHVQAWKARVFKQQTQVQVQTNAPSWDEDKCRGGVRKQMTNYCAL